MSLSTLALALQEDAFVAYGFGQRAYFNQTTLHPLGLLAVMVLGALTLTVKRRSAFVPLLVLTALIPTSQRIVILTLDFSLLRVLVLFGLLRVWLRGEYAGVRWQRVDTLVLAWLAVSMVAYVTLRGTFGAFVYKAGLTLDILGPYVLFRCWVRGLADVAGIARTAAWLSLPVMLFFFVEHMTGRNLFSVFGGASPVTMIRDGRLRCQGPYVHPIVAGSYWAVLLPLVASRWSLRRGRWLTAAGVASCLGIVLFSASSTPVLVVAASVAGAFMFRHRRRMRSVRWALLLGAVAIHFIREKPLWHLLARVSVVGGSTGYHRYRLVDAAINRFDEWWLMGTKSTAHWGYYLFDVTNQYVKEGVSGGFLGMLLFMAVLGHAFANVGAAWRAQGRRRAAEVMVWSLGVSLLGHCFMFLAVDIHFSQQSLAIWLMVVAATTSLREVAETARGRVPARARGPRRVPPSEPRRARQRPSASTSVRATSRFPLPE